MTDFKVGDKVDFKRDIEGHGVVVKVDVNRSYYGGERVTYFIGPANGPTWEQWHIAADTVYGVDGKVVVIEDGYKMWPA